MKPPDNCVNRFFEKRARSFQYLINALVTTANDQDNSLPADIDGKTLLIYFAHYKKMTGDRADAAYARFKDKWVLIHYYFPDRSHFGLLHFHRRVSGNF